MVKGSYSGKSSGKAYSGGGFSGRGYSGSNLLGGKSYGAMFTAPKAGALATYESRLSVNYGNGQNITYEQRFSIPLAPGTGLVYQTRLSIPHKGSAKTDYNGKNLDGILGQYSGRKVGTDGASALDGYNLNQDLIEKIIENQLKKDRYSMDKKEEKKYRTNCIMCGAPVERGDLCLECLNKVRTMKGGKQNGKDNWN